MTLEELRSHTADIGAVAATYGVTNIRVFGSTARGTARAESDVDLLVQLPSEGQRYTVFDHMRLQDALSRMLAVPVEVINDRCLDPSIAPHIAREAVAL